MLAKFCLWQEFGILIEFGIRVQNMTWIGKSISDIHPQHVGLETISIYLFNTKGKCGVAFHIWTKYSIDLHVPLLLPCSRKVCNFIELANNHFSLGRRLTYYTSVIIGVVGRLLIMMTSHNYVLFSISAVLGSLTSISIFQAPLIIAMETSEP